MKLISCGLLLAAIAPGVAAQCTVSTTPLNFGDYLGYSQVTANGFVNVSCAPSIPVIIQMDAGSGSGGEFYPRRLISGANRLEYNLFVDPAYTQVWGDGSNDTVTQNNPNATIYGVLPAGQPAIPGSYSDNVTITVIF